jgi:hypothetical protein
MTLYRPGAKRYSCRHRYAIRSDSLTKEARMRKFRIVHAPTITELEQRLQLEMEISKSAPSDDCKEVLQDLLSTQVRGEFLRENVIHQLSPTRLKESVAYDARESRRAA